MKTLLTLMAGWNFAMTMLSAARTDWIDALGTFGVATGALLVALSMKPKEA